MVRLSFVFFFSSRRRHTRSYGDWSSNVCSSDLARRSTPRSRCNGARRERRSWVAAAASVRRRSEERRVGKECRCRWSAYHLKKKERMLKRRICRNEPAAVQVVGNLEYPRI